MFREDLPLVPATQPEAAIARPISPAPAPAASPALELEAGQILFEQYRVERVVGKVGRCMLVKVRSVRHDQRWFLKCLLPQACTEPFASEEFTNAARAAMRLRSEYVAHTVDLGTLPCGSPYLVAESFEGPELRDVLRVRGALARRDAVAVVLQAAHALAEAHRHGIAHGSLSPSALLMTRGAEGRPLVKVLDFGSSATLRTDPFALRLRHWTQGTAAFSESIRLWDTVACTAPERLRDSKEATFTGDIWALGVILYELLFGVAPFGGESTPALLAAIAADEPRFPPASSRGVPRELKRAVLRCLSKSPAARFQSVHELAVALRRFAAPEMQSLVGRIARLQTAERERAPWFPASGPSRRLTREKRPGRRRLTLSLVLVSLGALAGVVAGTLGARVLAPPTRGSSHAFSHPLDLGPAR